MTEKISRGQKVGDTQNDLVRWLDLGSSITTYSIRHKVFFDLHMVLLRMADDQYLVYSPLPSLPDAAFPELKKLGSVGYILAPNHFHNLGIARFKLNFQPQRFTVRLRANGD